MFCPPVNPRRQVNHVGEVVSYQIAGNDAAANPVMTDDDNVLLRLEVVHSVRDLVHRHEYGVGDMAACVLPWFPDVQ